MGGCPGKTKNNTTQEYHKQLFTFLNVCGKGGFGRVWKVQLKKNRSIYALKVMSKAKILAKKSVQSIMNERNLLTKINSDFIVNMIGAFQDRDNLYLLMDFLNGGDLRYHINRKVAFNERQIKFIVACIMEGLQYLHAMNIIHRDIKPENIIFEERGYCRITDLGVARQWKLENSTETSGTPGYMAPEVMCRQNHSFCADYFAVGVIAYQLLTSKRPYVGKNRKQIRDQIIAKQVKLPNQYPNASADCIDFINKMIQRKPRNRLGYNGINQIKEHPFLKMRPLQKSQFEKKLTKAPFIPNALKQNYSKYDKQSEPSQLEKQQTLYLKKPQVQQLFMDYDYIKNKIMENQPKDRQKSTIQTTLEATHVPLTDM